MTDQLQKKNQKRLHFWQEHLKAITEDDHKALLPQYLDKSQLEGPANIS